VPSIQAYPAQRAQKRGWPTQRLPHQTGSFVDISVVGTTKPQIIGCFVTNPCLREPTLVIIDTAAMVLLDALPIPARALTSVTSTVEKSAMTQPPQQPPTQVFAQQRRSGCGTLLVALLVLAIVTTIVIFLGAFGLLDWIFS
jgi:hypothetical protein